MNRHAELILVGFKKYKEHTKSSNSKLLAIEARINEAVENSGSPRFAQEKLLKNNK